MEFRNLLFASAAAVALCSGGYAIAADEKTEQTRQPKALTQIGADGMPASAEEKAQREETPRDMAPQTDARAQRVAQTEKPGDQRLTTPLPPTTGTEAKAVTLSQVDRPDQTLKNVTVENKDGRKIGEVAQVTLDANGKAKEVVLNDRNGTRLAAGELVFEPERGVLITRLSPSDLAPAQSSKPADAPPRSTQPPPQSGY